MHGETVKFIRAKGQERNRGKYSKERSMKSLGVFGVKPMEFLILGSLQ